MKDVWVRVTLTAHMAVNVTFNSRRRLTRSLAERNQRRACASDGAARHQSDAPPAKRNNVPRNYS
jgi:hypothetical protein